MGELPDLSMSSKPLQLHAQAVIFDLDGVITDTASVHAQAWKTMFDEYLRRSGHQAAGQPEFNIEADYKNYIDGKIRLAGIASFLQSRGIELPEGGGNDTNPSTIYGLGNIKNEIFRQLLEKSGVILFNDAERCVRALHRQGAPIAVASSSKNCEFILECCGIRDLFQVVVDGRFIQEKNKCSKPAPDIFIEAARQLGVELSRTIIIEDAPSGVAAARAAAAAVVVGLDRSGTSDLMARGADFVVSSLDDIAIYINRDETTKPGISNPL